MDPDALKMFSFGVFSKLEGAVTAGMIHLGDRLGLYAVMASSVDGDTSDSLASKAGLHERWVREWLHNQVAARIVSCEDLSSSHPVFHLSPEGVAVLATPDHPAYGMGMFHRLPQTMGALEAMPEAFRTGVGHDYDSHGPEGAVGIERSFEPWNQNFLIPMVIPALDGLQEKLSSGIRVADIGCGSGGAALLLGATFPKSVIDGFDISKFALERAEERKSESGALNVSFFDPRIDPIAEGDQNFRSRVSNRINSLAAQHDGGCIAVVCHGGVITAYVAELLGTKRSLWMMVENTSITTVKLSATPSVLTLNDCNHLYDLLLK